MREIKFRAWDKCRKEYLSGGNVYIGINPGIRPTNNFVYLDSIDIPDMYKERFIIEQYTGVHDNNCTEIYEGDIIAFTDFWQSDNGAVEEECIGQVVWDDESASFQVTGRLSAESEEVYGDCKVVGNVHHDWDFLNM